MYDNWLYSTSCIADGPGLLYGSLQFAQQYRSLTQQFYFSNDKLIMKKPKTGNEDDNFFALVFKIPKLSFSTKFDEIVTNL